MRRIIDIFLCMVLVLQSSCTERMEEHVVPFADRGIVIDFSTGRTKALAEDTGYESRVDHIDIFIFSEDNSLYWYERASVSASEGSHTLSVGTKFFARKDAAGNVTAHPKYKVYLLANASFSASFADGLLTLVSESGEETVVSNLSVLGNVIQETANLHLSGLNLPIAPETFLMDALAKIDGESSVALSSEDPDKDIILEAELVRAAAKVVIKIKEGDHIEFTEGGDLDESGLFTDTEHGVYYIRNLPFKTYLLPGYYDVKETETDRLITTTKTNNAHFSWNPSSFRTDTDSFKTEDSHRDVVTITTYVYEHSWEGKGLFEFEPCAVVNLPLISLSQNGDDIGFEAHPNSWYKIPLSKGEQFNRNSLYKVNVIINYAGATTVMEPVVVNDIRYEVFNYADGNLGWNTEKIDISQSDRPKYLTLNTTEVSMHNTQVNEAVTFTSSADVSVSVSAAYYYDKFGVRRNIIGPGADVEYDAASGIRVSAPEGLTGNIKVESPVPVNNAPRYIEVKVSNGEAEDQYFLVTQYPLEYITNIQGYYSYREDFGGTTYEAYDNNRYVAVGGWRESSLSWGTYSQSGGSDSRYLFTSKVAKQRSDGTSQIFYYKWTRSYFGNRYSLNDNTQVSGLDNGRMYHVKIASSSSSYSVGIPKMDSRGWTDSGEDNKKLVSPSFMIASQLGATYAPSSTAQAASHCANYVETYKDENGKVVHLDDWRLPTEEEIKIIIRFQYADNAAMDEVLSGQKYWSATGEVENPQSSSTNSNQSAVRCIRNAFK